MLSQSFEHLVDQIKRNDLYLVNKNNPYLNTNQWAEDNALQELISYTGSNGILSLNIYEKILWIDSRYYKSAQESYKDSRIQIRSQSESEGLKQYIEAWIKKQKKANIKLSTDKWSSKFIDDLGLKRDDIQMTDHQFIKNHHPLRKIDFDESSSLVHDYAKKINLIQKNINKFEIHFITNPEDIAWLLNIRASDFPYMRSVKGKMLIANHFIFLFTDLNSIQLNYLKKRIPICKVFGNEKAWIDTLGKVFNSQTSIKVHFNYALRPGAISFKDHLILENLALNKDQLLHRERSLIEQCRVNKQENEIKVLKNNGTLLSEVMTESINKIQNELDNGVKISEAQVSDMVLKISKKYGAMQPCFAPIVASGKNSTFPHHIPVDKKIIKKGELIMLDIGFYFKPYTYASDMTRTFLAGSKTVASQQQKKVFTEVLKAFLLQYSIKFKPGSLKAKQLDAKGRDSITSSNLTDYEFIHSTGHGLGIVDHELAITIGPSSNITLQKGNTYSIEPGMYFTKEGSEEESFGIRLEDIVYIIKHNGVCCHRSLNYHHFDERLIDFGQLGYEMSNILKEYNKQCVIIKSK